MASPAPCPAPARLPGRRHPSAQHRGRLHASAAAGREGGPARARGAAAPALACPPAGCGGAVAPASAAGGGGSKKRGGGAASTDCVAAGCTAAALAAFDLSQWQSMVATTLPQSAWEVVQTVSGNPSSYTLTISWVDRLSDTTQASYQAGASWANPGGALRASSKLTTS